MSQYEVNFSVKGIRTKETISARSSIEAKNLIRARYAGCSVTFWSCTRVSD